MGPLQAAGKQQSLEKKQADVNQKPDPPQTPSAASGGTPDDSSGFPLSVTEVLTPCTASTLLLCFFQWRSTRWCPPLPAPKIKSDSEPAWKGAAYKLQTSGGAQKELAWQ